MKILILALIILAILASISCGTCNQDTQYTYCTNNSCNCTQEQQAKMYKYVRYYYGINHLDVDRECYQYQSGYDYNCNGVLDKQEIEHVRNYCTMD